MFNQIHQSSIYVTWKEIQLFLLPFTLNTHNLNSSNALYISLSICSDSTKYYTQFQLMVTGITGVHGVDALSRVVKGHNTDSERARHHPLCTMAGTVLGCLLGHKHATVNHVLVIQYFACQSLTFNYIISLQYYQMCI